MSKKKNYQAKKAQTKRLHQKKQQPNSLQVELSQIKYVLNELGKRFQGFMFGFDSYIKMKGDDGELNQYIKDIIKERKNKVKEKPDAESSGTNHKDSK